MDFHCVARLRAVAALVVAVAGCGDSGETTTSNVTTEVMTSEGPGGSETTDTGASSTSSTESSTGTDPSTTEGSSSSSGGVGMPVPTPCENTLLNFEDNEPNDTPETAIDGCTVLNGYWGNFPTGGTLGPDDPVDYVVFRTPFEPDDFAFIPIVPCWQAGPNLLDWYLYQVEDGVTVGEPFASESTADDCEGSDQNVQLPGGSVFLMEIRRVDDVANPTTYFW